MKKTKAQRLWVICPKSCTVQDGFQPHLAFFVMTDASRFEVTCPLLLCRMNKVYLHLYIASMAPKFLSYLMRCFTSFCAGEEKTNFFRRHRWPPAWVSTGGAWELPLYPHTSFRLINLQSVLFSILFAGHLKLASQASENHSITEMDFQEWLFLPTCGFL